ncbi:hypothetical protein CRUP_018470 [Coryphaenoides rupestris]|nr:hypothetical protein CRUP_018470 [Coryphaenoides rupestris]
MPREEMKRPLIRGRGAGSRPLEASASDPGTPVVGVLGTGDFSRSLTGRLVASGYQVVVGSRSPKRSLTLFPEEAEAKLHRPSCLRRPSQRSSQPGKRVYLVPRDSCMTAAREPGAYTSASVTSATAGSVVFTVSTGILEKGRALPLATNGGTRHAGKRRNGKCSRSRARNASRPASTGTKPRQRHSWETASLASALAQADTVLKPFTTWLSGNMAASCSAVRERLGLRLPTTTWYPDATRRPVSEREKSPVPSTPTTGRRLQRPGACPSASN